MAQQQQALVARELTADELHMVENALILARAARPYYGIALSALQPHAVDGLGTVAVDDRWRLYVDPAWFATLDEPMRGGVIAGHEIEHLLRHHMHRCEVVAAEQDAWNVAGDAEINDDCDLPLPPDGVKPSDLGAPDGLTAEQYLDYIKANQKMARDCGSGAGGGRREYELDGDGGVSPAEARAIRTVTAAEVRAHVAAHGRGSVPAGIEIWAGEVAKGAMPPTWHADLARIVGTRSRELQAARTDYSYARLHRRSRPGSVVRPAMVAYKPVVGIVADTSGSMGGEGAKVQYAVQQICRRFGSVLVCCDTEATIQRKGKKKFIGGGGTDLRPGIELAEKNSDAIVVITDCDTPWPDKPTKVPMIVVKVRDGESPKWAKTVTVS